jgi:hypothetical protein
MHPQVPIRTDSLTFEEPEELKKFTPKVENKNANTSSNSYVTLFSNTLSKMFSPNGPSSAENKTLAQENTTLSQENITLPQDNTTLSQQNIEPPRTEYHFTWSDYLHMFFPTSCVRMPESPRQQAQQIAHESSNQSSALRRSNSSI